MFWNSGGGGGGHVKSFLPPRLTLFVVYFCQCGRRAPVLFRGNPATAIRPWLHCLLLMCLQTRTFSMLYISVLGLLDQSLGLGHAQHACILTALVAEVRVRVQAGMLLPRRPRLASDGYLPVSSLCRFCVQVSSVIRTSVTLD